MIGVVVGDERADDLQPVRADDLDELAHAVGRIDDQRLAGLPVPDQVDEVHHLLGDLVVDREVAAGEELTEVEAVVVHGQDRIDECRRYQARSAYAGTTRRWRPTLAP